MANPKEHLKDLTKKHSFFEDVWDVARQIPKGALQVMAPLLIISVQK